MKKLLVLGVVVAIALGLILSSQRAAADEGWVITRFVANYTIHADGSIDVVEDIEVDFGAQEKHGIFRDLFYSVPCVAPRAGAQRPLTACPTGSFRSYTIEVLAVTNAKDEALGSLVTNAGNMGRIRIGSPDKTVRGVQTYRIAYRIEHALDSYSDHDEFFWNITGNWPVRIEKVEVAVHLPGAAKATAACFQGVRGSTEPCKPEPAGSTARYQSTRLLRDTIEQMTIVAGWQRGVVTIQPPVFNDSSGISSSAAQPEVRTFGDFFTLDATELVLGAFGAVMAISLVLRLWWTKGRDRRFTSVYYLDKSATQEIRPLFSDDTIVVEYLPPDGMRPGQMGVIVDEEADTLDVTATIIDLAVRGYIHITEVPKKGWFGDTDWKLNKLKPVDDTLLGYESKLLSSLFTGRGDEVEMSDLKDKFADRLERVRDAMYSDAMNNKWFSRRPDSSKAQWAILGAALVIAGIVVSFAIGYVTGRALVGAGIIVAGLMLIVASPSMSRRTALGSEVFRRTIGFRLYIETAETRMQQFNEQENVFARYLPFAIVFGCVDKWAKAFEGIAGAAEAATSGWYSSSRPFQVAAFTAGMSNFSSSVTSTISSSPSSSGSSGGGSGFSGGSSGGGGGGGGGGSW